MHSVEFTVEHSTDSYALEIKVDRATNTTNIPTPVLVSRYSCLRYVAQIHLMIHQQNVLSSMFNDDDNHEEAEAFANQYRRLRLNLHTAEDDESNYVLALLEGVRRQGKASKRNPWIGFKLPDSHSHIREVLHKSSVRLRRPAKDPD